VKVYLANAFSLSMLPLQEDQITNICVMRTDADTWKTILLDAIMEGDLDCAIGHPATARLAELLAGLEPGSLRCQRKQITLSEEDWLLVIQPTIRLPPGAELDMDDLKRMLAEGKIAFYTVRQSCCLTDDQLAEACKEIATPAN